MPLQRFQCFACESRFEALVKGVDPNPRCQCGGTTSMLMPSRVTGKVADAARDRIMDMRDRILGAAPPAPALQPKKKDLENPLAIPTIPWKKDYEDCSASERDERWSETKAAMTAWQTRCLESSGVEPSEARQRAETFQSESIPKIRAGINRDDGLT